MKAQKMPSESPTTKPTPGLTLDEICERVGTSRLSAERAIARLIERGLIREVKEVNHAD